MFLGQFVHSLDTKGRLAVPARFRASLEAGVVVTRGIDRCVAAYPIPVWEELAGKISALPMTDSNARQFRRMVFAQAANLTLDRQGRIGIPPDLRAYADIDRDAVIIGVHSSFEIWSPAGWETMQAEVDTDADTIVSRLVDVL
jgi:MraZ protein